MISIRSRRAGCKVSSTFAVQRNNILLRSTETSKKSSVKALFYSGSKISRRAEPGSP